MNLKTTFLFLFSHCHCEAAWSTHCHCETVRPTHCHCDPPKAEKQSFIRLSFPHALSRNLYGLTLTELLISAVIVGILMMGVVSLDSVVAKKRQTSSAENLLALNMRATINHISKTVLQAVGYGTSEHLGVLIGEQVGDQMPTGPASFCVKQDLKVGASDVNWTPLDDEDDRWACYTFDPQDHNIYFCAKSVDAEAPFRGAGRCAQGEGIGQAVSWDPSFDLVEKDGIRRLMFTLTLTSRYDPAKPKTSANPENAVTFSSVPPGHAI